MRREFIQDKIQTLTKEPMSRGEQRPYIPVTAFSQTDLFLD